MKMGKTQLVLVSMIAVLALAVMMLSQPEVGSLWDGVKTLLMTVGFYVVGMSLTVLVPVTTFFAFPFAGGVVLFAVFKRIIVKDDEQHLESISIMIFGALISAAHQTVASTLATLPVFSVVLEEYRLVGLTANYLLMLIVGGVFTTLGFLIAEEKSKKNKRSEY